MVGEARLDFSFSGLKTAVRQAAESVAPLTEQDVADICASFQNAVARTLKTASAAAGSLPRALRFGRATAGAGRGGGVAANTVLRAMLSDLCSAKRFRFVAPPIRLCTDNAVMIAWAGAERMACGLPADSLDVAPRSRWPLDAAAAALVGSGRRGAKA